MSLGRRGLAALAVLAAAALIYGGLGAAGVAPLPASVASLAASDHIGRMRVVTSGYYITLPFVAFGGPQLPPYLFAAGPERNSPGVHVTPALPDVKPGRVAAIIDTATGDGSSASPFVIHTLARWDSFVTALAVCGLIVLAIAFWLAGGVVSLVRRKAQP